jgi:hypothetical protein
MHQPPFLSTSIIDREDHQAQHVKKVRHPRQMTRDLRNLKWHMDYNVDVCITRIFILVMNHKSRMAYVKTSCPSSTSLRTRACLSALCSFHQRVKKAYVDRGAEHQTIYQRKVPLT